MILININRLLDFKFKQDINLSIWLLDQFELQKYRNENRQYYFEHARTLKQNIIINVKLSSGRKIRWRIKYKG